MTPEEIKALAKEEADNWHWEPSGEQTIIESEYVAYQKGVEKGIQIGIDLGRNQIVDLLNTMNLTK